jgi:hypothetical protein
MSVLRRTRDEFIDRWKHDLGGMIAEALTARARDAALSLLIESLLEKVKARLGQYWDDLAPL